jgi:hypothetical protein
MRRCARNIGSAVAVAIALLVAACGAGQGPTADAGPAEARQVVFSVANKDRTAPVTVIRVEVNERTLIYGALQLAGQGEYLYVSSDIDDRKMDIAVTSETEDGPRLEAEKTIMVEDRLWIVITRLRDIDGEPELVIEASYEKPGPWSEE